MKKEIIILVLSYFTLVFCNIFNPFTLLSKPRVDIKTQTEAARGVLERVLKGGSGMFKLHIRPSPTFPTDGFHLYKNEKPLDPVHVTAPNAVSALWGVNYYLKYYCSCHISWDGDQFNGISEEGYPAVNITVRSPDTFRFYQNPCASSYSYVWWHWERWEREIDWMAMNGINLALAFTAQEAIWEKVYDAFGVTSNDFTGPGFLAWYRMGNIRNFSQGFPEKWHHYRLKLQHKILDRMRELGITPVLPGFCGIIPRSLVKIFPTLQVAKLPKWNRFSEDYCCPYFLNPEDPLFSVIGQAFSREYIKEFGTNNFYSCDMFNENTPPDTQETYLTNVSQGVYRSMALADPFAVWVLQGWMFTRPFWQNSRLAEAFLKGVPIGKLLVLDLQSDLTPQYLRLNNYFGHSFIWCTLHNFGGQLGLYGHLDTIDKQLMKARAIKPSTMVGIGITPEGIDQNYIVYEFTLDSSLRVSPINVTDWVSEYSVRRYGIYGTDSDIGRKYLKEAWLILRETAYNFTPLSLYREKANGLKNTQSLEGDHMSKNILTKLPTLKLNEFIWYNKSRMYDVYQKFFSASQYYQVYSNQLFRHDFIDVTRQTIQFAVSSLYYNLVNAYADSDKEVFRNSSWLLLGLLDELEIILASGEKFLFGKWLHDAYTWGTGEKNCSYDARNQVTLWGPNGEVRDYAAKQWSGLIIDYYKPRWSIFIEALNDSLEGKAHYNSAAVKDKIFQTVEKPFVESHRSYSAKPTGNPVKIINKFEEKWGPILYEIFKNRTGDEELEKLRNNPSLV